MSPEEFFELAVRVVKKFGKITQSGRRENGSEIWHYEDSGFTIGMVRSFKPDGTEEPVENLAVLDVRPDSLEKGLRFQCFEVQGGKLTVDQVPPEIRGRLKALVVLEDMSKL